MTVENISNLHEKMLPTRQVGAGRGGGGGEGAGWTSKHSKLHISSIQTKDS